MDIFTIALYLVVIAWTLFMATHLLRQAWRDHVENRRLRRLNTAHRSDFTTKHGRTSGRRK